MDTRGQYAVIVREDKQAKLRAEIIRKRSGQRKLYRQTKWRRRKHREQDKMYEELGKLEGEVYLE